MRPETVEIKITLASEHIEEAVDRPRLTGGDAWTVVFCEDVNNAAAVSMLPQIAATRCLELAGVPQAWQNHFAGAQPEEGVVIGQRNTGHRRHPEIAPDSIGAASLGVLPRFAALCDLSDVASRRDWDFGRLQMHSP